MMRTLLFCGATLLAFSAAAQPVSNNLPSFVMGHSQASLVCQNSSPTEINTLLAVSDADGGQTEWWTLVSGPLHGTVMGLPTTTTSTGLTIMPFSVIYTPLTGYTGEDTFTVQIFDGLDTATTTIYMNVSALPTLSSPLTVAPICDGTAFNYFPTSTTTGSVFRWSRAFTAGIANPADTGSGNPAETLVSTSYHPIPVTYNYTIISPVGCVNYQDVTGVVKPTPRLLFAIDDTICSGATFTFTPSSISSGTTYSFIRATVTGITPATNSGTGGISETLVNTTSAPLVTSYVYSLTADGCSSTREIKVTVAPQPVITTISTTTPSTLCAGTNNQTFGTVLAPPAGVNYTWTATNAVIRNISKNGQYSIVDFPTPGNAKVMVNFTIVGAGCNSSASYDVTVGTGSSATGQVLYFDKQFVFMNNVIDAYQWGYDDAATLAPTVLAGETFQSYPNSNPDLASKYYWVKTTRGACDQKTYFNAPKPLAVANVARGNDVNLTVYPNPATNVLSVTVAGNNNDAVNVTITNMLGQVMTTQSGAIHNAQFDVTAMPAGCYLVSCSQNGAKLATTRFIKN